MIEFFVPPVNAEYVRHFPKTLPARHTARFGVPTAANVAPPASRWVLTRRRPPEARS